MAAETTPQRSTVEPLENDLRPFSTKPPSTPRAAVVAGRPPRDGLPISGSLARLLINAPCPSRAAATSRRYALERSRRPGAGVAHAAQQRAVHRHHQCQRRVALGQFQVAEDHLAHCRALAAQALRQDQREIAIFGQCGQALDGKGPVAIVPCSVLGGDARRRTRTLDDARLALGSAASNGAGYATRLAQAVAEVAAASCFLTASTMVELSGKPPSRYIECTSSPLIATSNEPSYHGTSSIAVSWWVKAFINASVSDSVCGS